MVERNLQINTENILPIIKKWLYSDRDVFVRELVSNACDALRKIQILRDQNIVDIPDTDLKIELTTNKDTKTLQIADTGIGMTSEEVEKYIAQVAFSGAEEFVHKYQAKSEIIGHFGLGFYSAYMVASSVSIDTLSYTSQEAALWNCDGSSSYTLEKGSRTERGTTITLNISSENEEFLEEAHLRSILQRYCTFLPFPIFLNGKKINEENPLWIKSPSACTDEEYINFYHTLYPAEPDPIFWIHLSVDYPFHLQGILYFPKLSRRFDYNQNSLKLFSNRVFVSDNCKDLIPDYLLALRGAIDSPDIPLNVSRSSLQMDKTVRQLSSHISKKVADRLATLFQTDQAAFERTWQDIELVVKLGIIQDDKFFTRAQEFLIFKKIDGTSVAFPSLGEKTYYTADASSPLNALYKDHTTIVSASPVDSHLFEFLEQKTSKKFQRLDGGLDDAILDKGREKTLLDTEGKTLSSKIADCFRSLLSDDQLQIEAKSLASDSLPALLVIDEKSRRMREAYALSDFQIPKGFEKRTFVVNTNSPLINSLYQMQAQKPDVAKAVARHIYDLARLSQKEIEPSELADFTTHSSHVLELLLKP